MNVTDLSLGTRNIWTAAMFAGTVLMPAAAILSFLFTIDAWRNARRPLAARLRDRRLDRGADRLRVSVGLGHDRLQAVELLTGAAILRRRKSDDQPDDRSRQDDLPEVRSCQSSPGRRRTRRPPGRRATMIAVDCVFRATRPTINPATTPLNVEPATIVPIFDGISGPPERSAVRPSNTPRMPPSSIANTGLLHLSS